MVLTGSPSKISRKVAHGLPKKVSYPVQFWKLLGNRSFQNPYKYKGFTSK